MNYESALKSLETDGFRWGRIRDYFPFGDTALGEGNYQRLAEAALAAIKQPEERQLLLDLLDAQACVFTEQVWVANEMAEKSGSQKQLSGDANISTAWLQINNNLRSENRLQPRDARSAMLKLLPTETLASRIALSSEPGERGV